ncbi:LPS export ABC transporter ATP-binding protein [Methylocystis suflitae]|uniref:LPS export ABC transporter ATP-binding protein n=1 Tax=Methylocystis suflitae TaxID=2951405 RepID=UPI00210B65C8|nr:LPS export ABC transporter ATP-binding protein [Methylocystis suflitae]MCQ4190134.1 LPS export ABC transporter ATP-binding protein [Methylocystis suflitae]
MSYLSALSMRFRAAGQSLARLANGVRRSRKPDEIAEGQWRDAGAQNLGADSDEAALDANFWGPAPTNAQAEPLSAFEPSSAYREPAGFDGQGLLSIHNLAKSYKARRVVEDVSLHVARGEAVGLLGPNGAGKTTVFYMITGLVKPDKGVISLDGYDVTPLPMYRRARLGIGYLPQEASVFRGLSVEDNIRAVLEITQPDAKKREEELEALLEEFRLTRMRHTPAVALSGGERRRCEIARALAGHPSFMLLDEPFAGIDPIAVGGIQDLVRHLKARGIGVLITDHSVRETLGLTDRAYIIYNGHVLTEGTPDEIVANPDVRRIYLGEDFRM